jgi:transcriptional repressor NrdR
MGGDSLKCPYCSKLGDKVVDSRESREGLSIRRRRECLACGRRYTTYEHIIETPVMVVKKDGRREAFDRQKILGGLLKACEKRPVPGPELQRIVDEIEIFVQENADREVSTAEIGGLLMQRLQRLDKVAYVRFASVYREFKDLGEFLQEINELFESKM